MAAYDFSMQVRIKGIRLNGVEQAPMEYTVTAFEDGLVECESNGKYPVCKPKVESTTRKDSGNVALSIIGQYGKEYEVLGRDAGAEYKVLGRFKAKGARTGVELSGKTYDEYEVRLYIAPKKPSASIADIAKKRRK